jgi:hypothetical protein
VTKADVSFKITLCSDEGENGDNLAHFRDEDIDQRCVISISSEPKRFRAAIHAGYNGPGTPVA